MSTNCCKCGKEAILNTNKECFACAKVGNVKYASKKATLPVWIPKLVAVLTGLLDVAVTFQILWEMERNAHYLMCIVYVLVHLAVMAMWWKNAYADALAPVIDLLVKVVVLVDIPTLMKWHYIGLSEIGEFLSKFGYLESEELSSLGIGILFYVAYIFIIRPVIRIIGLMVWFYISTKIAHVLGRKLCDASVLEMNALLDKEQRLQNFDDIKLYESNYTEGRRKNVYIEDINEAFQFIWTSDASDEVKDKVHKMLQSWDNELMANNEEKLVYYDIVQQCMMGEIAQDENGNWLDELGTDMRKLDLPLYIEKFIALSKEERYVTKRLFELNARIENEINIPWQNFVSRYNGLNPSGWMNAFVGDIKGIGAGEVGESRVARELSMYDDQMIVLPNIRLEVEGESIESDFVVISPWGIYILEVKNLGSGGAFDLLIEQDGRWSKVRGGYKETMNSPVHQNERHIVYMEKLLNKELGRGIDNRLMIHGMVVLANDRVTITNHSTNLIKRYDNIIGTIRSGERTLREEEMKQIAEILQENNLPPKEYPTYNYFKMYFETKVLVEEYKHWRKRTNALLQYANTYYNTILEKYDRYNQQRDK